MVFISLSAVLVCPEGHGLRVFDWCGVPVTHLRTSGTGGTNGLVWVLVYGTDGRG
jgi:hypothetical protein